MELVLVDFNAQIGKESAFHPTNERYSMHQVTNGERLINFAGSNVLTIMSTIFPHKNKHKVTQTSPKGVPTQIDHVLSSSRHHNSIYDIRSHCGPDVDSDHYLVVAKMTQDMKLLCSRNKFQRSKWVLGPVVEGGREVEKE